MKIPITSKEQLKFWQEKVKKYQKQYKKLKKQSPERWWHDEFFENQMRVLESLIINTKEKIRLLKEKTKRN